jgi:hypothetical protein
MERDWFITEDCVVVKFPCLENQVFRQDLHPREHQLFELFNHTNQPIWSYMNYYYSGNAMTHIQQFDPQRVDPGSGIIMKIDCHFIIIQEDGGNYLWQEHVTDVDCHFSFFTSPEAVDNVNTVPLSRQILPLVFKVLVGYPVGHQINCFVSAQ